MGKIKIGINGFGRIGRNVCRVYSNQKDDYKNVEVVAVNDLTDAATLAHLLKYDSIFGVWKKSISAQNGSLQVGSDSIKVLSEPSLEKLNWRELGVDIIIESTGRYTDANQARAHIEKGGAKKVIISAPAKNEDKTIVLGVNEAEYEPASHHVVSNASCTTNCLAPVAKVLLENFGIRKGFMNTVHSYTNDQRILDLPHKDLRRSRAAALSMIPTTTGAAKAVSLVLPQVKGLLDGMAIRVPTPDVSVVDLVAETEKETTVEELNSAFKKASESDLKGILDYTDLPLVSSDFLGNPASSTVDGQLTSVVSGNLVKVISWYDNEWGYSNRTIDLASYLADRL